MKVTYYLKLRNTYPERIYVLYGAWAKRNTRAMGISKRHPFFQRDATQEELLALDGATRMTYWQYESIVELLDDERKMMSDEQFVAFADALKKELRVWSKELIQQLDEATQS